MKQSKAYPYLKALLDGLIEAAPNWAKAPSKFVSSLSEQLKDKGQDENKKLEEEIESISEDKLRELIKEAGSEQKADLKFIVENIEPIVVNIKAVPEILQTMNYRFDMVDEKLDRIIELLQQKQTVFSIGKQEIKGDLYQAETIYVEKPAEKEKIAFPLVPGLHNQTPPEPHFVGREEYLDTITGWYKDPRVRIGALIGWGGVGKSALVRKWYDNLEANEIRPDGIFWWGFYRNAFLEQFLNALLRYVSGGQIEPEIIKGTWEKVDRIKEYIGQGTFLIILDGLEQMQKAESGDEFGKMNHRECVEMLHYLADAPKAKGLCLITTRYRLKDLEDWKNRGYENRPLIDLSEPDALLMLKNRGVKGDDEQIKEVIKRYKGHALSLTSLAGYLDRYYDGDIEEAPDVEFVLSDKERFKEVNKLLGKYAEKMSEPERVFLNIFSLFRKEITERDFKGVFRKKIEGTKFNESLVKMSKLDFKDLINGMVDWRLISCDESKKLYTTHPLIKSYFESDLDEGDKKLCHKQIYEYIGEYAPGRPETLEQMQPLFEQVYHGCAAGLYQEALDDVYWEKINRENEHFLVHQLGAWEIQLSLGKTFFPEGDLSQMPLVSKREDQSWLLNTAGTALLCTGRPEEAESPLKVATMLYIEDNQIAFASASFQNLADLQFRTAEIEAGLESAKNALEMAEKATDKPFIVFSKAHLGWILYLLGKTEEAERNFKDADELSMKIEGSRLYSQRGIRYATFLISMGRIDDAFGLTKQNFEICQSENLRDNISICHHCLGAIEMIKGNIESAGKHLQESLEIARKVGRPDLEIQALVERGRLWLDMEKYEDAARNANEVLKICQRTGFRFYEPDAEIVLGRAYMALKDFKESETNTKSAYDKAVGMKYRWAEGDAAHLLAEIALAKDDKKEAQKWLKKAIKCRKEIKDPKAKDSETILKRMG